MTNGVKVVVLSREYENISNRSLEVYDNEFKQYRWYEIITFNSKLIQMLSRTLEMGVQRSLVLFTQVRDCHLI